MACGGEWRASTGSRVVSQDRRSECEEVSLVYGAARAARERSESVRAKRSIAGRPNKIYQNSGRQTGPETLATILCSPEETMEETVRSCNFYLIRL